MVKHLKRLMTFSIAAVIALTSVEINSTYADDKKQIFKGDKPGDSGQSVETINGGISGATPKAWYNMRILNEHRRNIIAK